MRCVAVTILPVERSSALRRNYASLKLNFFASLFSGLCLIAATTVAAEDKIKIVASFSILGDMVEQVVGEHASITTIFGPASNA